MIYLFYTIFLICMEISDAIQFYNFPNPYLWRSFPFFRLNLWHVLKLIWIPSLFIAGHCWDGDMVVLYYLFGTHIFLFSVIFMNALKGWRIK